MLSIRGGINLLALLIAVSASPVGAEISTKLVDKIGPWTLVISRDPDLGLAFCDVILGTKQSNFAFGLSFKPKPRLVTVAKSPNWSYRTRTGDLFLVSKDTVDTVAGARYKRDTIAHATNKVQGGLAVLRSLAKSGSDIEIHDYAKRRIWTIPGGSLSRALAAMEDCAKTL